MYQLNRFLRNVVSMVMLNGERVEARQSGLT